MIGNFRVAFYGVTMALGMILGSMLILHEAKRTGQSDEDYLDIIIWCLISAVVGARAYYVIFAWDYYKDDLLSIFNIRGGGMPDRCFYRWLLRMPSQEDELCACM